MPISSRFVIRSTIGLLAVGFLALLGIIGTTTWLGERSQVYFNEVIEARDTRGSAVELRDSIRTAESSQRGFLVTGNEIYLAPFDSAKTMAARQFDALRRTLTRYPESAALLERLSAVIADKVAEMDQTIALKNDRRDAEALTLLRTNRGKALTDEANVYLSGIIRAADERLTTGVAEQRANAAMLRWISMIGGIVIILVVGIVTVTIWRYARERARARDEVRSLNASLERRVKDRTADLARARDHAEVLLAEVNHRVANSLTMVASLVKLQSNMLQDRAAKEALAEVQARIFAIASVHQRLYSSGDARFVALDEYLSGLLDQLGSSIQSDGGGASLSYELEPLKLGTDASINLGVVVTELVTNALKYAYPDRAGPIRVRLKHLPEDQVELVVEDDGVGRVPNAAAKGTGLGTRIVNAMAGTIGGEIQYVVRQPGTAARLTFPLHTH